jgi:hypothetical protein
VIAYASDQIELDFALRDVNGFSTTRYKGKLGGIAMIGLRFCLPLKVAGHKATLYGKMKCVSKQQRQAGG